MEKKIHNVILRVVLALVSVLFLVWSLLPYIISHIVNEGVKSTVLITLSVLLICIFWDKLILLVRKLWKKKLGRIFLLIVSVGILLLLLLFLYVSFRMLLAASQKPSEQSTVIVLGAAVRSDGPSAMLKDRLDAAIRYLDDNQESACIVSGGKGTDEPAAEADVMFNYLVENGIDPARIYKEDQSIDTEQNIKFSKEILEKNNLNPRIVIATQEFHEYRAQTIARREGLTQVSPCTCRTKLYLLECYWVREFAAVCRFWMLGY